MQITDAQTDVQSLAGLGSIAVQLLCSGDIDALGAQFGYALAYDRVPAAAIRADLAQALTQLGACGLGSPPDESPTVSYFQANDSELFALVEQRIPTDNSGHVLLELIVSSRGTKKFVVLEQVSAEA